MRTKIIFLLLGIGFAFNSQAKLNIVTTTTDLKSICEEIGGSEASVESISKGTQDPHFIEAKPSYMVKINRADLVVAMGLELEIGWLPSIIQGGRNPKVKPGSIGYLEIGKTLTDNLAPLEVITGNITRADGDVHPYGNPHFNLDPIRMGNAALTIAKKMAELDASNSEKFMMRAKTLQKRLEDKTKIWSERIRKSGVKKIVTYHKTLTYFFNRFQIENPAILEPKPGIPPTSGHIIEVIKLMKDQKIKLILIENYFDPTVSKKIAQEISDLRSVTVAVAVEGADGIKNLDDLYESLVQAIERK